MLSLLQKNADIKQYRHVKYFLDKSNHVLPRQVTVHQLPHGKGRWHAITVCYQQFLCCGAADVQICSSSFLWNTLDFTNLDLVFVWIMKVTYSLKLWHNWF